jgi:glutamyl-tRNA reductase
MQNLMEPRLSLRSLGRPWMLGLRADTAGAELRAVFARELARGSRGNTNRILLETCHRVELYGIDSLPVLDTRCNLAVGEVAVLHLMRVAAGLDSARVGEDEVLHQVRTAFARARSSRTINPKIQRLFETAIATGRLARAGRTESAGNLAQSAVAWLGQKTPIAGRPVLVVGAGRMGSALAYAANAAGATLTIASQDAARACRLAAALGADGTDLEDAAALASQCAGVVVALGGPWHQLKPSLRQLPPVADISWPRAIPAEVTASLNGNYLAIDDLFRIHRLPANGYVGRAEQIAAKRATEYVHWLQTTQ